MAGGKGTRLQKVTNDEIPKALVQINNKPLLDYVIEHAIKNDFDKIIICTGHLGHKIQEYISNKNYDASIYISQESEPMGTAGSLHLISDLLEDEFFIIYADVYSTINLKKMFDFHKKTKANVTIAVHKSNHPQDSTVVKIDKNGKYLAMIQKPGDKWKEYGNLTQTSLYIVKKDILNYVKKNIKQDFESDIFPLLLNKGEDIYGYMTSEYTKDMGTPERYSDLINKLQVENLGK